MRECEKRFQDRETLLAYVASTYYENGSSQSEIASELGLSRSMVSRLLTEARENGIIEIRVHWPIPTVPKLEAELKQIFGLEQARVLDVSDIPYSLMLRQLGTLAAVELRSRLRDDMILTLAWGTAIWATICAMRPGRWSDIQVVQCIGALGHTDSVSDSPTLAQRLAELVNGQYRYLHAPLVVDTEEVCQGLLSDSTISETLALARRADIGLVGLGTVEPSELSSLKRTGYLTEEGLKALRRRGAVGDVCARYYDIGGRPVESEINRRIIGITLTDLERVPCVVGVAGGGAKSKTILGALRGRYLDVLVTEREAAEEVLELHTAEI